jgi:acyl-CoA thioester hydrolase
MVSPIREEDFFEDWHESTLRVRYSETDKMGVVYHANYLVWFEIGRTEFCRARGFSYREMEENEDAFLVVAESYCRYKAPAYFDDELIIRTQITELRRRSLRFGYEILRLSDGQVIAEGETGHVVADSRGRVRSMPEHYRALLATPPLSQQTVTTVAPPKGERVPEDKGPA